MFCSSTKNTGPGNYSNYKYAYANLENTNI